MSIIPLALIRSAKGSGVGNSGDVLLGLAFPFVAPIIGARVLAEGIADKTKSSYQAMKQKQLARAQQKANKKEMEELKLTYPKLSEGKIGQVETEVSEDGNVKSTIIHTKYGPFIRTETNDYIDKKAKGEDLQKTSVFYSGFVVAQDNDGKKTLTYLDNAGQSVSEHSWINALHDGGFYFYTHGTVLTEDGKKDRLGNVETVETSSYAALSMPTSSKFQFVGSLEEKFQELLQQVQKQAEDNMQI